MNIPTPHTALGKAVERAIVIAVAAVLAAVVQDVKLTPIVYLVLKSAMDLLNSNIPNL